jgi:anaerobic ribonucleoside-triphosphate reductase
MAKIKSAQYMSLKLIQTTLKTVLAEGLENKYESIFTQFIKDLRAVNRDTNTFYAELFSIAFSLVAKRS